MPGEASRCERARAAWGAGAWTEPQAKPAGFGCFGGHRSAPDQAFDPKQAGQAAEPDDRGSTRTGWSCDHPAGVRGLRPTVDLTQHRLTLQRPGSGASARGRGSGAAPRPVVRGMPSCSVARRWSCAPTLCCRWNPEQCTRDHQLTGPAGHAPADPQPNRCMPHAAVAERTACARPCPPLGPGRVYGLPPTNTGWVAGRPGGISPGIRANPTIRRTSPYRPAGTGTPLTAPTGLRRAKLPGVLRRGCHPDRRCAPHT